MQNCDVSIIVVSYNTRKLTLECLSALYNGQTDVDFEVLVVDNASQDGSAEAIARHYPDVALIASEDNLGFAEANNVAAKSARGKYLLLLNPDTRAAARILDVLVAFAERHVEADIVGGRTLFADGSLNPTSCWGRPTCWSAFCFAFGLSRLFPYSGLFNAEAYGEWARDTVREVDVVTGCFLLIQRELWHRLDGFDKEFFMYGEDADLCLRARKLGARCILCPSAEIVHHGGASEPVRADKMVRLFRAKAQLFRKHWGPIASMIGVYLLDAWAMTRVVAFAFAAFGWPQLTAQYKTWLAIWMRRNAWHGEVSSPGR